MALEIHPTSAVTVKWNPVSVVAAFAKESKTTAHQIRGRRPMAADLDLEEKGKALAVAGGTYRRRRRSRRRT